MGNKHILPLTMLSPSAQTYREAGCGIWVSRVSACWVFLCTYIHAHRETGCGISVSRVSAYWVLLYTYTHTYRESDKQWYLDIHGISLLGLSVYIYTHIQRVRQAVISGYPWYQPAGSFCIHLYTQTESQTSSGIWVSMVSACWVFLYTSIHTYRESAK